MCLTIPAKLVEYVDAGRHFGMVEMGGNLRRVNTSLLLGADSAEPGDFVLVHIGRAVAKVREEEARETLEVLRLMDDGMDEFEQMFGADPGADQPAAPDPLTAARVP